jgi:predicted PurR-regulated permease PerM
MAKFLACFCSFYYLLCDSTYKKVTWLRPLLLGNKLSVHPLTILILLIWAWENYGFAGDVVIIPLYVILKVVLSFAFEWYKEVSGHY